MSFSGFLINHRPFSRSWLGLLLFCAVHAVPSPLEVSSRAAFLPTGLEASAGPGTVRTARQSKSSRKRCKTKRGGDARCVSLVSVVVHKNHLVPIDNHPNGALVFYAAFLRLSCRADYSHITLALRGETLSRSLSLSLSCSLTETHQAPTLRIFTVRF